MAVVPGNTCAEQLLNEVRLTPVLRYGGLCRRGRECRVVTHVIGASIRLHYASFPRGSRELHNVQSRAAEDNLMKPTSVYDERERVAGWRGYVEGVEELQGRDRGVEGVLGVGRPCSTRDN
ncbi:hypothetical protein E2C01_040553 [Portunus trituberculatus]|uniref:Uncharacterized protein n=1 Tax=Portunus trituberculatus TaxID=210409 RepID=A0A5B7FP28_PORTR|nr:hypothetical protein [Portunus trituberculatus]